MGRFPDPSPFSAENGEIVLGRHFDRVERHYITGSARFSSPDVTALLDAHAEFAYFAGIDIVGRLARGQFPLEASYRHAPFLAHARRLP